jgi:hypothetical protein
VPGSTAFPETDLFDAAVEELVSPAVAIMEDIVRTDLHSTCRSCKEFFARRYVYHRDLYHSGLLSRCIVSWARTTSKSAVMLIWLITIYQIVQAQADDVSPASSVHMALADGVLRYTQP